MIHFLSQHLLPIKPQNPTIQIPPQTKPDSYTNLHFAQPNRIETYVSFLSFGVPSAPSNYEMQQSSVLAISPSFSSYSSVDFSDTATRVSEEFADQRQDFGLEPKCNDFEFNCFANRDEIKLLSADEIFSNGEIRTVNSDLKISHSRRPTLVELLEEERYSSLSFSFLPESGEPSALPGTFCIWKPDIPAEKCKKTSSMGTLKRLRDLINRGGNDGKKTQIVISRSSTCTRSKKRMDNNGDDISADKEMRIGAGDEIGKSAHEIHYVKNRSVREADRRRSFLPYKKDLVGIFF